MGVDISDIVLKRPTSLKEHRGSILAVDAYNVLYQFLSNIRQPDGTPLMDSTGRVTSHLSGIFFRTVSFLQNGIRPVFVFDGKPHQLKARTISERRLVKEKTIAELELAREAGDQERVRSLSSRINYITDDMIEESKDLLSLMGIPAIFAPSEGEAQASLLSRAGRVNGVISQDYDCLLFGARKVFRNFVASGRRKIPGRNFYVTVNPEFVDLDETLNRNGISQDQLISIGILIGTDFNRGLQRVGAKTALNLIRKYGDIRSVLKERSQEIENLGEIIELFNNPPGLSEIDIAFGKPDEAGIKRFLCDEHSFTLSRIEPYFSVMREVDRARSQSSLDAF